MKRLFLGLMSTTLLLSGCSWLDFSSDGKVEIEPAELVKFEEEVELDKLWSSGGVGSIEGIGSNLMPALHEGKIYAADSDGNVIAVSAVDGDKLWDIELDVALTGGVGASNGSVFVGSVEGDIFALDAATGSLKWQATTSSEVLAAPVSNGSIVAVQSQDAKLLGLNAETGEQVWQFKIDSPVLTLRGSSAPLMVSGTVMASFANGKMYGLSADSGTQLWENRVAVPQGRTELERMVDIDGQPLLVGDVIYAGSFQGRLTAISRGTGRNLWYQDSSSHRGPAYGLGQIYMAEEGDTVRAFRASSGQVIWTNEQLLHRKLSAPIVAGGYVAVADSEGYLHILSQTDGHFVGRTKVDGSGVNAPMLTDGDLLYVQANDGSITAYDFESR